jgi:hypothetical protein
MASNNISLMVFFMFGIILCVIGLVNYSNLYDHYGEFSIERKHLKAQLSTSYGIGFLIVSLLAIILYK